MDGNCGCGCECESKGDLIQYVCDCSEDPCKCPTVEFREEPKTIPYCCDKPMKRAN